MKIAVCDDDAEVIKELQDILNNISRANRVEPFTSAEELLKAYELGKRYDLLFLDVIMDQKTGLEAANEIRLLDKAVMIVFISYYNEYMEAAFDVDAMKYIVKPFDQDKILAIYQRCLSRYRETHYEIAVKTWGDKGAVQLKSITLKDIQHIETRDKDILLHKFDGQIIRAAGPLKMYKDTLLDRGFVLSYRGCMVNLSAIESISSNEVILKADGNHEATRLPLAQGQRKELEKAFMNYTFSGSGIDGHHD